ncbi:MAG: tyrosine-type recombinase/integrase [Chloroflexota bacterium]|nr:tyrosine-type recombinase/integrase [Chloroflexota bacterium]
MGRASLVALALPDELVEEYVATLAGKAAGTVDAYGRTLRHLTQWIAARPGNGGHFRPETFTRTALETYLSQLEAEGYSISHRARVKAVAGGFARWLIEEKELLRRNPTRGVEIPAQAVLAPRRLDDDQRYVLRELVERADDPRGAALFALGYWAGCRVSDVSWLRMERTHIGPKTGWLHVGYKGGKARDIDLLNEVRKPLAAYLQHGGRDTESPYVFTSQREERLSEAGIHHWFRTLKARATRNQWPLIAALTFHDLRHDFAHRARDAGWSLEEVAYYLGHVTKKGTPAIQTTARYTQVSREQVKAKLRHIRG